METEVLWSSCDPQGWDEKQYGRYLQRQSAAGIKANCTAMNNETMVRDFECLDGKRNFKLKYRINRDGDFCLTEPGEGVELGDVRITDLNGNSDCT